MNRRNFLRSAAGAPGLALTKPILEKPEGRQRNDNSNAQRTQVDRTRCAERDVDRPPLHTFICTIIGQITAAGSSSPSRFSSNVQDRHRQGDE